MDAPAPDRSDNRRIAVAGSAIAGIVGGAVLVGIVFNRPPDDGTAAASASAAGGSVVASASASEVPSEALSASPSAAPDPSSTPLATAGWEVGIGLDMWVVDVAETDARVIAVGQDDDAATMVGSEDGVDWVPVDLAPLGLDPGIAQTVTAGDAGIVATGGRIIPDPASSGYSTLEPFLIFSTDGVSWEEVDLPGPCAWVAGIVSGEFGFVILGERCRNEGDFDPRPISVLHSADGRSWTVTTSVEEFDDVDAFGNPDVPSTLATDGSRVVAMGDGRWIWISNDAGVTWTRQTGPMAEELGGTEEGMLTGRAFGITHGSGRFVMAGADVHEGIGYTPRMCTSVDAVAWECRTQEWMIGLGGVFYPLQLAATPTGYVSLMERLPDEFTAGPSETVLITSVDGLEWTGGVEPDLHNLLLYSLHATTRGTFMLGATNPYLPEDLSETRIAVHRGPLP